MIEAIINRYIKDLKHLRENEAAFEQYKFKLSEDKKRDINQLNRQRIGVGLLNDLRIPEDYNLVKKLIEHEVKQRTAKTENYEYDVIYLFYYLLSEFKVIEDIWSFAELKFDGTMDADTGFETSFFLTYGKENLRFALQSSSHKLRTKIFDKIFYEENAYRDTDGEAYKEQQHAYFGLKLPLKDEPGNYRWIKETEGFRASLNNWKKNTDLFNESNAYRYIGFAEYLGAEDEIESAIKNYLKVSPKSWLTSQYKVQLRKIKIKNVLQKISAWFQWSE